MNREQAKRLIKETFESSFRKDNFIVFIKNSLNQIDENKAFHARGYVKQSFKQVTKVIKTYERIGTYTEPSDKKIDILIVYLQKRNSLERARTTLRNFVAKYLKDRGEKNAALAAFVSPDEEDWRFSLVKVDYNFDERGKVIEEKSPARRWSFLVGKNEKSHTAQSRLVSILEDDEHNPTLAQLEEAFNIEPVTKEFFDKYRNLLIRTVEVLDSIVARYPIIKKDFASKNINTVDFAKKLLGQIVFLYFLQKKGWFGVERDAPWGRGPKDFLRRLFNKEYGNYKNFFNNILEPLFYEALAKKRDGDFYSRFNCKIPFLNGGLFEPIGGYDWVHTDILLPNELFSNNRRTREGDIGDGILDVFDRFNFTVKEDEPLEKEVAIDPELLGKLYEKFNAIRVDNFYEYKKALASGKKNLEKQFNKKFGVYYTPREIVHYMCQQSLIYYLEQELQGNVSKEDIEKLIKYGEQFTENETTALIKEQKIKEGKQKSSKYKPELPESIRKNAKLIDEKLKCIKVCDPAVGSGAFLVGMMHEIVKTRGVLSAFIVTQASSLSSVHGQDAYDTRTIYNFKRECIENSLYGVDIDSGACEVAKLRLWLSLIVDEEDIEKIKPLPNLDYKIMQGNSLISEFLGINFDVDKEEQSENLIFEDKITSLIRQFQSKKNEFLNEPDRTKKEQLRQEIENLIIKIFEEKIRRQKSNYFSQLKSIEERYSKLPNKNQRDEFIEKEKEKLYRKTGFNIEQIEKQLKDYTSGRKTRPFFPWRLYFAEVFHEKGGFDIVIANPPYDVYQGERRNEIEVIRKYSIYDKASGGKLNTYKLFLAKSIELQKPTGIICEIFQNSFLADRSAAKIRRYFIENQIILQIDSFPERDDIKRRVFEDVKMSVCILFSRNIKCNRYSFRLNIWEDKHMTFPKSIILDNINVLNFDLESCTIPSIEQSEIKILEKIYMMPRLKQFAKCYEGEINLTFHKKYLKKERTNNSKMIKGAAVQKWLIKEKMSQGEVEYLDHVSYLKENRGKKTQHFKVRRIVMQGITGVDEDIRLKMTIIDPGIFCGNSVNYILIKDNTITHKYLLALLNSFLMNWYFKIFSTNSNVNGYEVDNLPIPKLPLDQQKPFIDLVDKILAITKDDDYLENPQKQAKVKQYERQIDQLVYKLYGLTQDEIKIVENSID